MFIPLSVQFIHHQIIELDDIQNCTNNKHVNNVNFKSEMSTSWAYTWVTFIRTEFKI